MLPRMLSSEAPPPKRHLVCVLGNGGPARPGGQPESDGVYARFFPVETTTPSAFAAAKNAS